MNATVRQLDWLDQYVKDQLAWARCRNPSPNEAAILAFEAGIRQGWMSAIHNANLHDLLKEEIRVR